MIFTLTWATGFLASFLALAICKAEGRAQHNASIEFDKPLRRSMARGLALAAFGLIAFYAFLGAGLIWPGMALAILIAGLWLLPWSTLAGWGGAALPLALLAFVCVIAAFQQLYGDNFFGFDDPFGR